MALGPSMMLFAAAEDLPSLKPEQKAAIEKLDEPPAPGAFPGKELHEAILAGVKAGNLDPAKLEPQFAAMEKAAAANHEKEAEKLNALHKALDAAQRKELVAAVRKKQAERADHPMKPKDAPAEKDADIAKRKLERLTKELELDAAQQKKVEPLLTKDAPMPPAAMDAERDAMKKRTDALLTAFEGDAFDAKKLEAPAMHKKMREHMTARLAVLAKILPILKLEQREKLAASMEKGRGRGKGGWGGQGMMGGFRMPFDDHGPGGDRGPGDGDHGPHGPELAVRLAGGDRPRRPRARC